MDRVMPLISSEVSDTAFGRRQEKTWLVTGHYARVIWELEAEAGRWEARLARARDRTKDQSYFLSSVPSSRLAQVSGVATMLLIPYTVLTICVLQ